MKNLALAALLLIAQPILSGALSGGAQSPGILLAQSAPVPTTYQDLYTSLDSDLSSYESTINSSWNGTAAPVAFSTELQSAHSNQGSRLFTTNYYTGVLMELDSLKAMGVQAVTVSINYPILYSGFYTDQAVYQQYVDFYTQLATDIRARNLKMIVKTAATSLSANSAVAAFYSSQTEDQYDAGRAQQAQTIASLVQPDYLSVLTEPDTESWISGFSDLGGVSGSTNLLNTILSAVRQSGAANVAVGAGVGAWTPSFQSYIQSYAATSVDYIDIHSYPINNGYLSNILQIATLAAGFGKPVAMSEAWLTKVRDNELLYLPADQTFSRDPFSFWAPLDMRLVTALWKTANYDHFLFFSPFWSQWFRTNIDYDSTVGMTTGQIFYQASLQASQAIAAGQYTPTGLGYAALLINPPDTTAPTAPTNLKAYLPFSGVSVWLTWNASSDDTGVAGYNIYRDGTLIGTAATLYFQDKTAAPSTAHTYTIAAYDISGNLSAQTSGVTVNAPADTIAPSVPAQLAAQGLSISQIQLTWAAATDNVTVAYYTVYRNGSVVGTTSATSYTDSGLSPATTYSYAVSAADASGNSSALSASVSGVTLGDTTPPSAPANLAGNFTTAINLTWTASTDNVGVTGYRVYRGTSPTALAQIATTSATAYTDGNIVPGTTYNYAVSAYDAAGNAAQSGAISVTTAVVDSTPPSVPANLFVRSISSNSVTLSWTASTDKGGVAGYKIYRGTSSASLAQIATTSTTKYTDSGLSSGTTYYYAVAAYDQAGNTSALSFKVSARTSRH